MSDLTLLRDIISSNWNMISYVFVGFHICILTFVSGNTHNYRASGPPVTSVLLLLLLNHTLLKHFM